MKNKLNLFLPVRKINQLYLFIILGLLTPILLPLITYIPLLKYRILLMFVFLTFGLVLINKDKIAIVILVFLLPFHAAPFGGNENFKFVIGLNAFIVWSIWLGIKIKRVIGLQNYNINWKVISPKIVFLYYFLFVGLLLAVSIDQPNVYSQYVTKKEGIVNFSLFIVTAILFIKILVNYRSDVKFQTQLLFVFATTSMVQFGSYIINQTSWSRLLPNFLTNYSVQLNYVRFIGLLDDYELIVDYSLIVIAFSLILFLKNKHKKLVVLFIILAALIGLLSGTRSFFVVIGIFIFFILTMNSIIRHNIKESAKFILIFFLVIIILNIMIKKYVPANVIFERFNTSVYLFKEKQYEESLGRRWYNIPVIIKNSGLLGNGSLFITNIENTNIVAHTLYGAIYARYGIIGLFALLYMMFSALKTNWLFILRKISIKNKSIAIIYFSLLISLFIQQTKISGIRSIASILMYCFIFLNVYFFSYNRNKEIGSNGH